MDKSGNLSRAKGIAKMIKTIKSGQRSGIVKVPSSKSQAHRVLIIAALAEDETDIICDGISRDIEATVSCLNALGARINIHGEVISVFPIRKIPKGVCRLECGESGSTLRFMLPLVGALGANAEFFPKGRLIDRPLAPLDGELIRHGMKIEKTDETITCSGKLSGGEYMLAGNVSSQYISGLLMALPVVGEDSILTVTGEVQSENYITMTEDAMKIAGLRYDKNGWSYHISGLQKPNLPGKFTVEGDYSSASFFLCMGAFSEKGITVSGLNPSSNQGDKQILKLLSQFGANITPCEQGITVSKGSLTGITIDASQIPDIIPPLCVVAAAAQGETHIVNAGRLRIKESDRIATTCALINSLGGNARELPEGIVIHGTGGLKGGKVDSCNDHRIAMSAALAASICAEDVIIDGAECVAKSYPRFWDEDIFL